MSDQLSTAQRRMMEDLDKGQPLRILAGTRRFETAIALVYKGLIYGSGLWWYDLTQRGRDWLRFVRRVR